MDRERFDALVRMWAVPATRRGILGALLGTGLAGAIGDAAGKKKTRKSRQRGGPARKARGAAVSAEATCASPGPSSNLNGCNFNDDDLTGVDLSSSAMKETTFRRAILVRADLSSSNLKSADFRQADLTCANLRSSACGGANFNGATFCRTRTCNGSISDRDCPDNVDLETLCCDCGSTALCEGGQCVPADVCLPPGACPYSSVRDAVLDEDGPTTLRVAAGTYAGRFNTQRTMTIIGAGSGPGGTVLVPAAGDQSALIGVGIGFDLDLLDLTLSGQTLASAGGAMRIFDGSTVNLTRVLVTDNTAAEGGGILNGGDLTLKAGTVITGNTTTIRGGGGIRNASTGTLTLENGSRVADNDSATDGGGIFNAGALTLKTGSRIEDNDAIGNGGGIFNENPPVSGAATAMLEAGSVVTLNTAGGAGGGIFASSGTVTVADDAIVTGNTSNNCRPVGSVPNCID